MKQFIYAEFLPYYAPRRQWLILYAKGKGARLARVPAPALSEELALGAIDSVVARAALRLESLCQHRCH